MVGKSTTGTYLIPVIVVGYDFYLSRYYSSCDESLYAQYAYVYYITHAFMQGDYANAPTETEALTSFLDDYKDAMENRKAGGRSFR